MMFKAYGFIFEFQLEAFISLFVILDNFCRSPNFIGVRDPNSRVLEREGGKKKKEGKKKFKPKETTGN